MACSHYLRLRVNFGDGNHRSPISADRALSAAGPDGLIAFPTSCETRPTIALHACIEPSKAQQDERFPRRSKRRTGQRQAPGHPSPTPTFLNVVSDRKVAER